MVYAEGYLKFRLFGRATLCRKQRFIVVFVNKIVSNIQFPITETDGTNYENSHIRGLIVPMMWCSLKKVHKNRNHQHKYGRLQTPLEIPSLCTALLAPLNEIDTEREWTYGERFSSANESISC